MFVKQVTDELSSLDMPQALVDLLIENSFDRERLLKMSIDDLGLQQSLLLVGGTNGQGELVSVLESITSTLPYS